MSTSIDIFGMGAIGGWGRGFTPWQEQPVDCNMTMGPALPDTDASHGAPPLSISRITSEHLKDREALRRLRRADRFSKMAALAAWDAARAAGLMKSRTSSSDPERLGIVVTTAFGPHRTTFAFLDDILDFGDAAVSPTTFSHSVHNAAAAYIGIMLNRQGPTCTLTDFNNPLGLGLHTARQWLLEKRCTRILVGYVEETSEPMETIAVTRRTGQPDVELQPFRLSPDPETDLSEGSVFLTTGLPGTGGQPLDIASFTETPSIRDLTALWNALPGVRIEP